jgi:hypothetical protein
MEALETVRGEGQSLSGSFLKEKAALGPSRNALLSFENRPRDAKFSKNIQGSLGKAMPNRGVYTLSNVGFSENGRIFFGN